MASSARTTILSRLAHVLNTHRRKLALVAFLYALVRANKFASRRARNNAVIDRYDFTREIVLVTGGSSGIGLKLVQRLANRGMKVVILDLQQPPTTAELSSRVKFYQCNITRQEEVKAVHAKIVEDVGNVTILINNAGVVRNATILDKTSDDLDFTFGVNLYAHYWLLQAFLPDMLEGNHGHIITVSSLAAFLATPKVSDYNASKAAVTSLHESLALELKHVHGKLKIRTSIIHPSYVKTELHREGAFGSVKNPLLKDALNPDQVAAAIEAVVLSGESKTVMVPDTLGMIGGSRGWSEWAFRALMDRVSVAALQ